jgi:hypothetical protein
MMPEPWWHYLIAPDALRAAAILAAAFAAASAWKRWRIVLHRHPWKGVMCVYMEGPWPIHYVLGFFSIDVLRRS